MKYIVGIDEVGRGPLAGPVTVGMVACEEKFYKKLCKSKNLPPLGKDSKKLTAKLRQKYARELDTISHPLTRVTLVSGKKAEQSHITRVTLVSEVEHVSNAVIDKKGISGAIRSAIQKVLKNLNLDPAECKVLLDGGLKAPTEFKNQKTIIKGDEKEKIIAWASILAKVSRDDLMIKAHKKFPEYGFDLHKGYGTARHRNMIEKYGLSSFHRKSFCKRFGKISNY